jgi:hypothetical protein
LLIDRLASTDVHEDSAWFHLIEKFLVENVDCIVKFRQNCDNEISLSKDPCHFVIANDLVRTASMLIRSQVRSAFDADDFRPEAMFDHLAASCTDVAKANDCHCLCVDVLYESLLPLMRCLL